MNVFFLYLAVMWVLISGYWAVAHEKEIEKMRKWVVPVWSLIGTALVIATIV
jgi:hypothetical protein